MTARPPAAVVFDLDQTLWDFTVLRDRAIDAVMERLAREVPDLNLPGGPVLEPSRIQDLYDELEAANPATRVPHSRIRREALTRAARQLGIEDPEVHDDLVDTYFSVRHGPAEPYDDVIPTLRTLKGAGTALAVLSNGNTRLHLIGLDGWWDAVVLAPEVGLAKPDPAIFELVADRLGVAEPSSLVSVGDNLVHDIEPARALGWRAVHLDREATTSSDDTINTLEVLPGLLGL